MTSIRIASLLLLLSLPCSPAIAQHEAGPDPGPQSERPVAKTSGLFSTGNATLNKVLASYSLGKVAVAENLAVVTIRSTVPVEASHKHLPLDEALKQKLLTVQEVSSGGSVPELRVISHADTPIFLPFGSILTGGKQDRMLREDVLLEAKETRKISVYCIEQGRWRQSGSKGDFGGSYQQAPQSLKALGKAQRSQSAIWGKVSERNLVLGNPSPSSNIQDSQRTAAFNKLAKQLEPVRHAVAKQEGVCGTLVIVDGKAVGSEICAGEAYFKKIWPQLFNSYAIDAASRKEIVKTDDGKAKVLAEAFFGKMRAAKVTERRERDLVHLAIESDTCLGNALIEHAKGRLVNLSIFPKPKEAPPGTNQRKMSQMDNQRAPQTFQPVQPPASGDLRAAVRLPSSPGPGDLTADNVAESVGSDRWNWTVFVKGNAQRVAGIKCVQYTLHPSFPNPVNLVCETGDPRRPFGLSASGWGTFNIEIRVFMKDGSHKDLQHELRF